jgi:hypothetical protein
MLAYSLTEALLVGLLVLLIVWLIHMAIPNWPISVLVGGAAIQLTFDLMGINKLYCKRLIKD